MVDVKKPTLRNEADRPPLVEPVAQYEDVRATRSMYFPHARVPAEVGKASMTRQEFAEECNVNVLMARFEKTGVWPYPLPDAEPRYLDVSEVPDLQTAMQVMIDAEAAFMSLPAIVRKEFENNSLKFVEFAQDKANLPQMRAWGLAPPEPVAPAPMRVEVVVPPGTPAALPASSATPPPSAGGASTQ